MNKFMASASCPILSSILPCAATFCLMSKLALPQNAGAKRIGAAGAGEEA